MPDAPHLTAGTEDLAAVVRRHGGAAVARVLGRSSGAIRNLAAGRRAPGPELVAAIATAYGIEAARWRAPAGTAPAAPAAATISASTPATPAVVPVASSTAPEELELELGVDQEDEDEAPGDADARAVARENVDYLRRWRDRLDQDPEATPREIAQVATALTSATRLYARTAGALEVTPRMIVASPHWASIVEALVEALAPFPDAAACAAKAIAKIGGT